MLVQIAQYNAVALTRICRLSLHPNCSNQFVNISLILLGPCKPKVTCNIRHKNLA
jgi:hypothetical protein